MKTVAVIQARMGSSRLPGKVLQELAPGISMLASAVNRVREAKRVTETVIATTVERKDDVLETFCRKEAINCYRGSENDVLDRYYEAAKAFRADRIIRITSDCPFIDPDVIDQAVDLLERQTADYASNVFDRSFPRGLDCEAFTFSALEKAHREAKEDYERIHATPYIYRHPELFKLAALKYKENLGSLRLTVDTPEDLEFSRQLYSKLPQHFRLKDILAALKSYPQLVEINKMIVQKSLHEG